MSERSSARRRIRRECHDQLPRDVCCCLNVGENQGQGGGSNTMVARGAGGLQDMLDRGGSSTGSYSLLPFPVQPGAL